MPSAAPPRNAYLAVITALVAIFAASCADTSAQPSAPAQDEVQAAAEAAGIDRPETATLVVSTERTYEDPDRAADDREKIDIAKICGAVAACSREKCTDDEHAMRLKGTTPKTPWGKLMVDHLAGADIHRSCRRLVKLLKEDNLGSISPDCLYLIRHCG